MSSRDTTAYAKNIPVRGNVTSGMDRILNKPRAAVYLSTTQSIATGTVTLVTWDTLEYDTDGMWDPSAPTRLTAKTAGLYMVVAFGVIALGAGAREAWIETSTTRYSIVDADGTGAIGTTLHCSWPVPLNSGDYVAFSVTQTSGGPLNLGAAGGNRYNGLAACLIST